jgi:hypothetical protein
MGSTTANGLPYPVGTDRVMDGDNAIQALAEAIDAAALFAGNTGVLTAAAAGFTPASGITGLTGSCLRRNGVVAVSFSFTVTAGFPDGEFANRDVVVIPAGWAPLVSSSLTSGSTGGGVFYYAEGTPSPRIKVGSAAAALAAGAPSNCAGTWLVA